MTIAIEGAQGHPALRALVARRMVALGRCPALASGTTGPA
jgi:hypothetical protein